MQWETKITDAPKNRSVLDCGPICISAVPANDASDGYWQHFLMSFGQHSQATRDECMMTWPREALAKARAALDEFEAKLEAES